MNNLTLDEVAAMRLVLEFISVRDLLSSALEGLSANDDVHSKEQANVCFEAITSFLK